MKNSWRAGASFFATWLLCCLVLLAPGLANATTYNLPAGMGIGPFSSCSLLSGTTYRCTSTVSISNNDTVSFSSSITLNITGDFVVGNNSNVLDNGNTVAINATGNVQFGNSFIGHITISAGGSLQIGNSATVTGDLSAGGNISVGNSGTITGNVSAGGTLNVGGGTTITGTCSYTTTNTTCAVSKPVVTTNAATSLTNTGGATLNGTVSSQNASTTVSFDYGLTTAYGSTATATQSPLAASATNAAVSKAVTGLACGTLYHFRVKAVNSAGTTLGNDLTFTTLACLPTVTTNAASAVATYGATVNGLVSSNGASTTVTFDYGTTTSYGLSATASQSPLASTASGSAVSVALSGLTCNTTYHFRVKGVNSVGTANGSDLTFTTSPCTPVADYHFDECGYSGTSGEIVDSVGAYPATSQGALPTTMSGGKVGRALNLDALNKYVTPNSQINLPGNYTIAFWGQLPLQAVDSTNAKSHVVASVGPAGASNEGDFMIIRTDTAAAPAYTWRVYRSPSGASGTYSVSVLSSGWHHFAVVAQGGTSNLYVDGVFKDSIAKTANSSSTVLGLNYIGASASDTTSQALRMPLDEFMVFNGALPASAVSSIYTNQNAGKNYDGTTRTATTCSALDHIQVEHDGSGNVCSSETLTVKACGNAACSTLYTAGATSGNVTWTGTLGGTVPFSIASGAGQTTVSLAVASAQTVTLGSASVSPSPAGAGTCRNTAAGTTSCSLVFTSSGGCFDAVEVGAAASTPIYTKLSGTAFNLDVVTSTGAAFTGSVEVSLVDPTASSGNCTDLNTGLTAAGTVAFSANTRKTVVFNYPNAAKNVKVRMRDATASTGSCSSDNFAIRPLAFTASTTTAMNPASDRLKAANGAENFNLTASAGVTSGYTGTPALDATQITDQTAAAITPSWISGLFSAGTGSSASGSGFKYSEVGRITLGANAIVDTSFTAVDQVTGTVSGVTHASADCVTSSTSNSLSSGKYGCNIGNSNTLGPLGWFTPDHFTTSVVQGCLHSAAANDFTYSRQPFSVTVTALNASNQPTTRFNTSTEPVTLSSPATTGTVSKQDGTTPFTIAASGFTNGVATVSGASAPMFTFTSPLSVPETITIRANTTYASAADEVTSNGSTEGTLNIRSGRLHMLNALGSELLPLRVPLLAEYWDGSWKLNTLDTVDSGNPAIFCTALTVPTLSGFTKNLTSGETLATLANANLSSGDAGLRLSAPGSGNAGSVTLTTTAPSYLQFDWDGNGTREDPSARATFGFPRSPVMYMRENY